MVIGGFHWDIILIVIAIIIAYILYKLLKSAKTLIINMIVGFVLILLSNFIMTHWLHFPTVPLNWVSIIVTALTGALGALVLIIAYAVNLLPF